MEFKQFAKKELWIYVMTAALGCLYAFSYILFIVPNDFAPSGINGIAIMVQYKLNFSVGYMSLLINIPLCIFAYFFVDKGFAFKTATFCIVYSLSYLIFQNMDLAAYQYDAKDVDTIYPVIISGLVCGMCYGLLFKHNSSTGGTDVISKFLSKRNRQLNFFYVTFIINALIAVASYFVYGKNIDGVMVYDYKPVCLCLLYSFISSFTGNRIITGSKEAYKFIIITASPAAIENELIKSLHHTVTRIHAQGGYTHRNKELLICIVNKHQLVDCETIIKKYPETFAFVENVNQTYGRFNRNAKQSIIIPPQSDDR